jgi:hypothetical protein
MKKAVKPKLDFLKLNNVKIIAAAVVLLFLFFAERRVFMFAIFVIVTGIIIYYTKLIHFPIDVSPLFFLEIVITRYYGIGFTLLYIFLAYIVPKTFAGTSMKWDSYVFIGISMFANLFVLFFTSMPLHLVGYITSVIQYIGGVLFQSSFKPPFLAALDGLANVTNNIIWFLIFSDLIVFMMR